MSRRVVLTAHHCTTPPRSGVPCDHSDEKRLAILGRIDIERSDYHKYYTIPVVEVRVPPNGGLNPYNDDSHDFAMVILKHPAKYSDWVRPICLPHPGVEYGGMWAQAAGWGRTDVPSVTRSQSPTLKVVWLKVNPRKYRHKFMFGTYLMKKGGVFQDPCSGDSG